MRNARLNRLRSFTLASDPYEIKNLASDPASTANLEAELETLIRAVNYTVPPDTDKPVPAARAEK